MSALNKKSVVDTTLLTHTELCSFSANNIVFLKLYINLSKAFGQFPIALLAHIVLEIFLSKIYDCSEYHFSFEYNMSFL
jgi:hypothetical protein